MTVINRSEFTVMVSDDKLVNHTVYPGQPFPKGVTVTNPLVLGEGVAAAAPDPDPEVVDDDEPGDGFIGDVVEGPPPQSGKGSGRPAWIQYARDAGDLEYDDDWSRDEIVADLRERGIAVE